MRPRFYCESSTTTLSPSIWHQIVSTLDWGKVSTAGGLYYHIESQYLTHEVSTHSWGQVSTAKGQYNYIVSNIWHMKSVHITEAKYLLLEVSTTTSSPSFWHMKSVHITEAKVLLLDYYIESRYLTLEVSTHHWGQGSTAIGHYYYNVSQFLTTWCQYTLLRQSFYCKRSVLLQWPSNWQMK